MSDAKKIACLGKTIALISAILLILGSFLSWGTSVIDGNPAVIYGLEGDGKITIALGALATVLLILKRPPHWFVFMLGVIAATIGVIDYLAMRDAVSQFQSPAISGSIGIGLYLIAPAGLAIMVGTFIEMIKKS